MAWSNQFGGARAFLQARRSRYLFGYPIAILLLGVAFWLGAARGWPGISALATLGIVVVLYLAIVSLWAAHQIYDGNRLREILFELGQLGPADKFVHVSLGLKRTAVSLSRRLVTGQVIVIDVYNPQLTPSRTLARAHRAVERPQPDPRVSWRDGSITLLPLPDDSVPAVTLVETVSHFWQEGDRTGLLQEVQRILSTGGRLVLAERTRTRANFLAMGPEALRLRPDDYWRDLLVEAGFRIKGERSVGGLMYCVQAIKPRPGEARQLVFEFDISRDSS